MGLYAGFECLGGVNHGGDFCKPRIVDQCPYPDTEGSLLYNCSGIDAAVHRSQNGQRLACHGRFIDHGFSVCHFSVQRNYGAATDTDLIPRLDGGDRDRFFLPVFYKPDTVDVQRQTLGRASRVFFLV